MASVLDGARGVAHARHRVAGRLDDHVDSVAADCRGYVVGQLGRGVRRPAGPRERLSGPVGRRVRNDCDLEPVQAACLGEQHRPELAGADERDPKRPTRPGTFVEELERPGEHERIRLPSLRSP
jgi:hypothetical protein